MITTAPLKARGRLGTLTRLTHAAVTYTGPWSIVSAYNPVYTAYAVSGISGTVDSPEGHAVVLDTAWRAHLIPISGVCLAIV